MSVSFTLPTNYALVAAVGLSTSFLSAYQSILSIRYRIKAKIRHPQYYAELKQTQEDPNALKFNCAQRAHENTLEHLPIFLVTLAWSGIRYPLTSSALGFSWIIGNPELSTHVAMSLTTWETVGDGSERQSGLLD
ncbi:hypothetical protein FRC17_008845, partial [Serendipita sp. 399]